MSERLLELNMKDRMMVNNSLESSENEKEAISGNDDIGQTLSGCSSIDDVNPHKSYARRRKCNEKVQVCEKQKKRESYQRVSSTISLYINSISFEMHHSNIIP